MVMARNTIWLHLWWMGVAVAHGKRDGWGRRASSRAAAAAGGRKFCLRFNDSAGVRPLARFAIAYSHLFDFRPLAFTVLPRRLNSYHPSGEGKDILHASSYLYARTFTHARMHARTTARWGGLYLHQFARWATCELQTVVIGEDFSRR